MKNHKKLISPPDVLPALSVHAKTRMQQRCISHEILKYVCAYGKKEHYQGAITLFLNGDIDRDPETSMRILEKLRKNPYIVYKNGCIITAGWRHKRIKKNYRQRPGRNGKGRRGS